jgi:glycine oxidase
LIKQVDYIIVGQGLAGSCLALQLIKRSKRVMVFDIPAQNKSSVIAAGLYNPVTGKKLSKTWLADNLFPYLIKFYGEAETITQAKFLYEKVIYRPFVSVEEQNEWMSNSADSEYAQFIQQVFLMPHYQNQAHDPYGGLLLKQSGYLDTKNFITAVKDYLVKQESYAVLDVDFQENMLQDEHVMVADIRATSIVFCGGIEAKASGPFSWLPIRPLKGETLSIEAEQIPDCIFNRGVYLVPERGNMMKAGATYETKDLQAGVTTKAREELMQRLNKLVKFDFTVIGQEWGIRPTSPDRRPICGQHPVHQNCWIFNGLGTKGVSLAPYFSENLAENMLGLSNLNKDVDIKRYYSLY